MCLAVPLKVERMVNESQAIVLQGSTELEIDTSLLESVQVGDYVIVHAGYAIDLLDPEEASVRIEMFDALIDNRNES